MAKKAKKARTARKSARARSGKHLFHGDLPAIRRAINTVAKEVERGRKAAQAAVATGKKSAPGSTAASTLAANQAALQKAESLLAGLKTARTAVAAMCCNNDQGCNFLVVSDSSRTR